MTQKPLTKTQANAAFLKQSNHFTRLGTPSNDDAKLLLNSLASMLSVLTGKEDIRIRFDFHDAEPEVLITNPRHVEPQWGINWPEEPSSYRYFAVKDEWEALEMANAAREWTKNLFAEHQFHLEIYPVLWEADFGDHAENMAEHYESLKADLEKCAGWTFEKIGYADKELKFYSIAEYWGALKARSKINAHYPVFAHIIKSGEHGLETLTLRTIRDDIDQLLSAVQTQPISVTDSTDSVGIPLSCGKPHCSADAHHVLCELHPPAPTPTRRPEPIEVLSLSVRAQHLLLSAGIQTIPDLAEKTESELLRIKGLGQKSLAEIMAALQRHIGGQAA